MRWNDIEKHKLTNVVTDKVTLRDINRLKRIRRLEAREHSEKLALRREMYGQQKDDLSDERVQLERDRMEFEMEKTRAELELEIERAEITNDRKDDLRKKAMRALQKVQ